MGWLPGEHGRPHHTCTGHLRAPTLVSDASRHPHLNAITNSTTGCGCRPAYRPTKARRNNSRVPPARSPVSFRIIWRQIFGARTRPGSVEDVPDFVDFLEVYGWPSLGENQCVPAM